MPIATITREVTRCSCRKCKHIWDTFCDPERPPVKCPKCLARDWNQTAKLGRPRTIRVDLPKPTKTRLEPTV